MHILISSYYLDLSGTPTYTLTLRDELAKRGYDVTIYSPAGGALAGTQPNNTAVRLITGAAHNLEGMEAPDIIIAQANTCAVSLRDAFPGTPLIFSAHGVTPPLEQPPPFEADWYTAINEDVMENLVGQGVQAGKIDIVRDFVNTERFCPVKPLHPTLERVLFISNFKKWTTYYTIDGACRRVGAALRAVGAPYGRSYEIEKDINEADLVISTGRGVLEAMACGRPTVSFNQVCGDGYLTSDVYMESRTRNFAGDRCRHKFDVDGLAGELAKYNPVDGATNRVLAIEHHGHGQGVDRILGTIGRTMRGRGLWAH